MAASPVVSNQAYTVNPLLRPRVFLKALFRGGGVLNREGGAFLMKQNPSAVAKIP